MIDYVHICDVEIGFSTGRCGLRRVGVACLDVDELSVSSRGLWGGRWEGCCVDVFI